MLYTTSFYDETSDETVHIHISSFNHVYVIDEKEESEDDSCSVDTNAADCSSDGYMSSSDEFNMFFLKV